MKKPREGRQAWSPGSEFIYARNLIEKACPENRPTLRVFEEWLREEQCLSPATVTIRLGTACTFVDEITDRAGGTCACQAFESLTSAGVEDFFVQYGKGHGPAARRSMQASMRLFLKFAASRGWVGGELAEAVPSLPVFRLSGVPEGLRDEELSMVLSAPWEGCECPLRNRTIILLLSTYGVRRSQVSALQFDDIDWLEGTILFSAHKGGKEIHHDLTQAAAESLADYLRNERPTSDCNYVFLRHRPPHVRLNPAAISEMVRARMERCGLPPRYPHSFRHAFATRLLRSGQPVKAIADLLGHRSLDAVAIYAKVDHVRLLEVAIDWPAEVPP
jgi:integrase/recombinase XerD